MASKDVVAKASTEEHVLELRKCSLHAILRGIGHFSGHTTVSTLPKAKGAVRSWPWPWPTAKQVQFRRASVLLPSAQHRGWKVKGKSILAPLKSKASPLDQGDS